MIYDDYDDYDDYDGYDDYDYDYDGDDDDDDDDDDYDDDVYICLFKGTPFRITLRSLVHPMLARVARAQQPAPVPQTMSERLGGQKKRRSSAAAHVPKVSPLNVFMRRRKCRARAAGRRCPCAHSSAREHAKIDGRGGGYGRSDRRSHVEPSSFLLVSLLPEFWRCWAEATVAAGRGRESSVLRCTGYTM